MRSSPGVPTNGVVSRAYSRIYSIVSRIPRGSVMTYGQVARLAGMPRGARTVGYALRAGLHSRPLPWQRVMGQWRPGMAHVTIKDAVGGALQRTLLEREGVRFTSGGIVDLARYGALSAPSAGRRIAPRKR